MTKVSNWLRVGALLMGAFGQGLALAQEMPELPKIEARAYLLLDLTADQILASRESQTLIEPASLTKLMTAYLVFDALEAGKLELGQALPVSERAWRMPGSRMFIEPRMRVSVDDMLKGLLVQSGNDAAVALAEAVSGSVERFVELMNAQAASWGMVDTVYRNPTGLPEAGHVSTAADLAKLATHVLRDFPKYASYFSIRRYRYEGTPAANDGNRNLLLSRDPSVDGLKTGHTETAGYCIVATGHRQFPSLGAGAEGDRRLIAVVLGADSEQARANEAQILLNWGFSAYDPVKLFKANQAVVSLPVWKGDAAQVELGRTQPVIVAVPAGSAASIATRVRRREPLVAPLLQGEKVGELEVSVGGRTLSVVPLHVLHTVDVAGVFGQAWDALRLWIR